MEEAIVYNLDLIVLALRSLIAVGLVTVGLLFVATVKYVISPRK